MPEQLAPAEEPRDSPGDSSPARIACVVDTAPGFQLEALRWFAAATRCADVLSEDLVIHALAPFDTEVLRYLESQGVEVVPVGPFDVRSPHCNKIAGAASFAARHPSGAVVLTDTDLALLSDPRSLAPSIPGRIGGKTVDLPNPPIEVLDRAFEAAGLVPPEAVPLHSVPGAATRRTNLNGGLYVLLAEDLGELASAWGHWAHYLLDRPDLLDDWTFHVDQIAMALAIVQCGLDVELIPAEWNFPTHLGDRAPSLDERPRGLHYHREIDAIGRLKPVGLPEIDEQIARVNAAFADVLEDFFPNRTFWDWRYATNPKLGSGVGSRGEAVERKRILFDELDRILQPVSVLDVGCGDGVVTGGVFGRRYTGLDVSEEALQLARANNPEGSFIHGTLANDRATADMTICLDVLIHQADKDSYLQIVEQLVRSAGRALLVSGYDQPPSSASPMIYFHEPLSDSLRRLLPDGELYPVMEINDAVAYLVLLGSGSHPRDFGAETLATIAPRHPHPLLLLEMRLLARRTVRFYPDHVPRLWEYPVVAEAILRSVGSGATVVDIGAGVNPLVPYLTTHGIRVHTVDPASLRHPWPIGPDVNEWGFLDFAETGLAERSWNCTLEEVDAAVRFDLAFSVSVVEHLPATVRRALLSEVADRLPAGGGLVLTVDLVRGSNALWNRSEGRMVDPPEEHGTLEDFEDEAVAAGFRVVETSTIREWGETHVDIGWLVLEREAAAPVEHPASAEPTHWLGVAWERVRPLVPARVRAWAFPRMRRVYYKVYPRGRGR